jgi:hypothetical protein
MRGRKAPYFIIQDTPQTGLLNLCLINRHMAAYFIKENLLYKAKVDGIRQLWMISLTQYEFDIHGTVHRRWLSRNTNKMQLCNKMYYSKVYWRAQHVSSGTPLIIRSSKLYLQPLVYIHSRLLICLAILGILKFLFNCLFHRCLLNCCVKIQLLSEFTCIVETIKR